MKLDDIIENPPHCLHRAFDLAIERLQEKPIKKPMSIDEVSRFPKIGGEIIDTKQDQTGFITFNYRFDGIVYTLLASNIDVVINFVDGKYPIDSHEFKLGTIVARDEQTGRWVDGREPHEAEYDLHYISAFYDRNLWRASFEHMDHAIGDRWTFKVVLDPSQAAKLITGKLPWSIVRSLTYFKTNPKYETIIDHNPFVLYDSWADKCSTTRP